MHSMTHRNVVVEEEQHPEDNPEGESNTDPLAWELPESHKPCPTTCRLKCARYWECVRVRAVEAAPVCEPGDGNEGDRHAVVVEEPADVAVEERGAGRALEEKAEHEHDEREDELDVRAVERAAAGGRELAGDDLHSVLQVDPRDEEAEGVAWEAGHVFQEIAPCR